MGLTEDDIDEGFIAEARAVLATGTHLSHPRTEAAVLKALTLARKHGARTALDIDYRPNLWGVAGHGEGESRFVESAEVTRKLQATLHLFDLIVGTEEEFHIAGGTTDTIAALRAVRRGLRRDAGLQARRRRARSPSRARSPTASTTARPARASRSRSSTCSAPATASSPACSGAGSPTRTGRPA